MKPTASILLVLLGSSAHAAERFDSIIASLQHSWFENVMIAGSAGSLDWVHPVASSSTAISGLSWRQVGPYRRLLAHLGGELNPTLDYTIDGDLDIGGVDDNGYRYRHLQTYLRLSHTITAGNSAAIQQQYIAAGPLDGQLLSAAWTYGPRPTIAIELKQMWTIAGNLGSEATSVRLDHFGALDLFGGVAVGRTAPQLFDTPALERGTFAQYYVGLVRAVGKTIFTLAVDRCVTANSRQWDTTLVASVPLPGRR